MHAVIRRTSLTAAALAAMAATALPAVAHATDADAHTSGTLTSSRTVAATYSKILYAKTAVKIHKFSSTSSVTVGIAYPGQALTWYGLTTTGSNPMVYIHDTATGIAGWVVYSYLQP